MGHCGHRSETEGSLTSPSSQKGSRSPPTRSVRCRDRARSRFTCSRSSTRHSHRSCASAHSSHGMLGSWCSLVSCPSPHFLPCTLHAPSRSLPLFPSMTPPRYESPTPTTSVMGPPAPCRSSQSAPRVSAHFTDNQTVMSPPKSVHVPTSIDRRSLDVGQLQASHAFH